MAKTTVKESIDILETIIETDHKFYTDKQRLLTSIKSYNLCLESVPEEISDDVSSLLKVAPLDHIIMSSAKNQEQIIIVTWENLVNKAKTLLEILSGRLQLQEITERERSIIGTSAALKDVILDSSEKIRKLEEENQIQSGLYYIVLIDLVGSTNAAGKMDPQENIERINKFIGFTKSAINNNSRNKIEHLLQIKDASLILFCNFEDILDWYKKISELLQKFNDECDVKKIDEIYKMYCKVATQAGEVHFYKADPIALAVDQVFKIEKYLKSGYFGVTDRVREIILPRIFSKKLSSEKIMDLDLEGEENIRPLWNIIINS